LNAARTLNLKEDPNGENSFHENAPLPRKKKNCVQQVFPNPQRKISSGKIASRTAKFPSRKFAKAIRATNQM